MDFRELLENRRSVRNFEDRAVEIQLVKDIINFPPH
jgi:hypothetical protein